MSSFITTTRHETESTYAIDSFFSSSNYSSPAEQRSMIVTSSPTNQSNPMTYDCLPHHTTSVSTIPIENLSIANEWMSPLGLNYSEYNQQDMNFLFAYNELVIENKDNVGQLPLENFSQPKDKKSSQFEYQKSAEQSRQFLMMDSSRGENFNYMTPQRIVGSSSFVDYNPYQQEKEARSSMPNVFTYQQAWNQSQLLQKRPVNSDYMSYNPSSSVSLPLKKHTKKRSMVDQVLQQDDALPCVVSSSTSEPIPTSWMQSRKRTKSIQTNCIQENEEIQENYINDVVPSSDESSQVLAAMPRRQKLRYEGDHYTPKWVRYTGHLKEGYCDSCNPGKWLQLKNSAYWYHKQFYHGISSVSGKSFMKPIEQRMGKGDMIEGLCHQCHRFVPTCNGKKKNNYMLWYRHAHKCHLYDKPKAALKTMRKASLTSSPTLSKQ